MQASWLALKAIRKTFKKRANCDKTFIYDNIVYAGASHFWWIPLLASPNFFHPGHGATENITVLLGTEEQRSIIRCGGATENIAVLLGTGE